MAVRKAAQKDPSQATAKQTANALRCRVQRSTAGSCGWRDGTHAPTTRRVVSGATCATRRGFRNTLDRLESARAGGMNGL